MSLFEKAYQEVCALSHRFEEHEEQHLSQRYQESEVRKDFLDRFFSALGWDVDHREQTNPREQEVKIERGEAASMRKADYAFYLKPDYQRPVFLVEAKKPSASLRNVDHYFQTARYGFNTSTSVAILTDFQEFHLIDCRRMPERIDSILSYAGIKAYSYRDYRDRDKFGEIYWLFSREAVELGKLKEYWKSLPKPRKGAKQLRFIGDALAPVDETFLATLDGYRKTLASEFRKSDKHLTPEELTEAAQKVIDRLVFIRFLEDKQIERDYILPKFRVGSAWKDFIFYSSKLDKTYNGVVFKRHFIDEPSFEPRDDAQFFDICESLNHQNSPYLLSYIPVEILGSIYERFLGKIVILRGSGVAIDDKPEVRKAGGVYYTPKYIVDYIVEKTVGSLLEGQTPEAVSKLRFADIACGSGSFLVGIFTVVEKYLEDWYNAHPIQAKQDGCREIVTREATKDQGEVSRFILSIEQKRSILKNNLYGVDIDSQAVEVAQFSLFLKLLESETIASVQNFVAAAPTGKRVSKHQLTFHHGIDRKVLPDLSKNIQCGNSLVEYDIQGLFPLGEEAERRIKPFSFKQQFKHIVDQGGFDAVVGNPPWVFGGSADVEVLLKQYFKKVFESGKSKVNLFALFFERGAKLLRNSGTISFIVPNTILRVTSYDALRKYLLSNYQFDEIVDLGPGVFQGVTMATTILRLTKRRPHEDHQVAILTGIESRVQPIRQFAFIENDSILNIHASPADEELKRKVQGKAVSLGSICRELIFGVVITKNIKDLVFDEFRKGLKPFLEGRDISRYYLPSKTRFLRYEKKMLHRARTPEVFEVPEKIVIQRITGGNRPLNAAYDDRQIYNKESINNIILNDGVGYATKYVLALINSTLLNWFYRTTFTNGSTLTVNLSKEYLSRIPIRTIDFSNRESRLSHDRIVDLVDQILESRKRLAAARSDTDREQLQRKCKYLDGEIDRLVYELYELSDDEIKSVEVGAD